MDKYLTLPANTTADKLKQRLIDRQRTFFLRFGDSELNMLENPRHSSKTQANNGPLQSALREAIKVNDEDYLIAPGIGLDTREYSEVSGTGLENPLRHNPQLDEMGRSNIVKHRSLKMFENCHALTLKFMYDIPWFIKYCELLHRQDSIFIGGESLCVHGVVQKMYGYTDWISMPDKQSFGVVRREIKTILERVKNKKVIICVLGAAGKVLGHELWRRGWGGYFLDPGSITNAMAGQMVRGWIANGEFLTPAIMERYERYQPS